MKTETGKAKRKAIRKRRSKPRRGVVKDPAYLEFIADQICIARKPPISCHGRITVHHVRRFGEPKQDRRTVPLCEVHHLHDFGPFSIERLGKRKFEKMFDLDLEAEVRKYQELYENQKAGATF